MVCRKLLALPFLPAEHIAPAFDRLESRNENESLAALFTYIGDTWMRSSVWPPHRWTVYQDAVRTNNDVEGWHRRLNCQSRRGQQQFYMLADTLYQEAEFVGIQTRLVAENKLKRYHRAKYSELQGRLYDLWGQYENKGISASKLLRECGKVYSPTITV